ncbi:hypothetical protein [Streptomyces sp. NPDC048191]|uniref:hypothetical protein n=1 Tax=Streptomyces sp. NPDC048191 TaxID=3155484 RepID=UPI0033F8915F
MDQVGGRVAGVEVVLARREAAVDDDTAVAAAVVDGSPGGYASERTAAVADDSSGGRRVGLGGTEPGGDDRAEQARTGSGTRRPVMTWRNCRRSSRVQHHPRHAALIAQHPPCQHG